MRSTNILPIAIIGCGKNAKHDSELLGPNQLVGTALDTVLEKAEKIIKQFDVPAYADRYERVMKDQVDVAVTATHTVD